MASVKSETSACTSCGKILTKKTLDKNGGLCGSCRDPEIGKLVCPGGCGMKFKESTFKKNGGTCAKCKSKQGTDLVAIDPSVSTRKAPTRTTANKISCIGGCGKQYIPTSIGSDGMCRKCSEAKSKLVPSIGIAAKPGFAPRAQNRVTEPVVFKVFKNNANATQEDTVPAVSHPRTLQPISVSAVNKIIRPTLQPIVLKETVGKDLQTSVTNGNVLLNNPQTDVADDSQSVRKPISLKNASVAHETVAVTLSPNDDDGGDVSTDEEPSSDE